MDERSHQHSPMPTAPDGAGAGQPHAPWPGALPTRAPGAPIAGTLPYHGQPQQASPQFAYAPGFVLPGAGSGHPAPMSANGGMIGAPQPHAHDMAAPAPHHPAATAAAWQHAGATAVAPHDQPQAWAYQTPQGLQLVQPGAAAWAQQPAAGAPARRRVRWETIVPAAAVTCLVAAIGIFFAQFDEMTGRDTGTSEQAAARTVEDAAASGGAAGGTGGTAEVVAQATGFFEQGRFDDAANLLHPLLEVEEPDPQVVALHDRVDAAATRNRALLGRLARERSAGRWSAVVGTIGELERLRPLSKDLVAVRGTARRAIRTQAVVAKARSLMARGRDGEALAVVDRGLEAGSNRQLEAMREQLSARLAAPAPRRSNGGSNSAPPAAGGAAARPNRGPAAQPPANVPQGAIPTRPDLPNPTGGTAAVAPTVGGGAAAGADCHEHDGVRECH